jgi:hypothetical protein
MRLSTFNLDLFLLFGFVSHHRVGFLPRSFLFCFELVLFGFSSGCSELLTPSGVESFLSRNWIGILELLDWLCKPRFVSTITRVPHLFSWISRLKKSTIPQGVEWRSVFACALGMLINIRLFRHYKKRLRIFHSFCEVFFGRHVIRQQQQPRLRWFITEL